MTNPLNDDDFDGNDDQIEALKEAVRESRGMIEALAHYVSQDLHDLEKCGTQEEIKSMRGTLDQANAYLDATREED
jgi:NAD(P)H-dependent FMN reductase